MNKQDDFITIKSDDFEPDKEIKMEEEFKPRNNQKLVDESQEQIDKLMKEQEDNDISIHWIRNEVINYKEFKEDYYYTMNLYNRQYDNLIENITNYLFNELKEYSILQLKFFEGAMNNINIRTVKEIPIEVLNNIAINLNAEFDYNYGEIILTLRYLD